MIKELFSRTRIIYLLVRKSIELFEEERIFIEQEYMKLNNIRNKDGSIPSRIYTITDDEVFEKASEECNELIFDIGLNQSLFEAKQLLNQIEELLLKYGLSFIPSNFAERKDALERNIKKNYTVRNKIINMMMDLDISTIPKV